MHGGGSPGAEDEALEQGIAGQAVRAVDPRAGDLASRIESRTRRASPTIGVNAAHDVVRRRPDGNRIPRKIQPDPPAHVGNRWKPLDDVGRIEMRECQKNVPPGAIRLSHDAPRDDVAWSQVGIGVKPRHEGIAATIDETRALAPQRFGNEKSRRSGKAERGRMKLHELEIRHPGAGVIGEGNPIAGRDAGVGCLAEHLTGAARRKQRGPCVDIVAGVIAVDKRRTHDAGSVHDQPGDERMRHYLNTAEAGDQAPQHAPDLAACAVAGVEHAAHAVRRFAPERRPAPSVTIEPGPPLDQFADVGRTFPDEHPDGGPVAQPVASSHRIRRVQLRRVIVAHRGGDAALSVSGVAFGGIGGFGEDDDSAGGSERHRCAQPRDATADNQKIRRTHAGVILPFVSAASRRRRLMDPIRIDVTTPSRPYTITLADGAIARLAALLDEVHTPERRFVVSSPHVWRLHGPTLARALPGAEPILVPDGERYKQLPTVARIYDALVRANADRASALITFGGGVIGDMAGFAAATYLRGIALVHVPTTLLAQVDSSIGGKVGVNHPFGKNLIGSFHQPRAVVIDPSVLRTLPRREFRAGLYETIKYGMTSSAGLFDRLSRQLTAIFAREPEALIPVITESCRIKAAVVSSDEREAGLRRILNFGHTAGHALEAVTKYRRFRHGEAVGYGMLVAAELATLRGALAERDRKALADLIAGLGPLPPIADVPALEIIDAMRHDKKVVAGRLHFVLPTAIGVVTIVDDVTDKEVRAALTRVGFRA